MFHPIFAKCFSRHDRKRLGCCGLVLCFILSLSICSTFKPRLHPLSPFGDGGTLRLSMHDAIQDKLTTVDSTEKSDPTVGNGAAALKLSMNAAANLRLVHDTSVIPQPKVVAKMVEPLCRKVAEGADYCAAEGDIRIQPDSSTIFVVTNQQRTSNSTNSWTIQPYPRDDMSSVKYWSVKLVGSDNEESNIPECTQNHNSPAVLFSLGGFLGNHFHDFADLLFPLYTTSFPFRREVHFLASDIKPWWIAKFQKILNKLSKHQVVDTNKEKGQVHCYPKFVAGLKFYSPLIVDQSASENANQVSMQHFRQLLRGTYSLKRNTTLKSRKGDGKSPRLMIVSRKRTRILTNEGEVSRVAKSLGFKVVSAEADTSTNLSKFAKLVNSCDVMMGIHGAGLTNMLFIPDNAVLIQLVPFGNLDNIARLSFGDPAVGMNIRYLEYKVSANESSLSQQYSVDHPVLKDPMSIHRKGWNTMKSIYLENQNVTVDVRRFEGTLVTAMKLLRH